MPIRVISLLFLVLLSAFPVQAGTPVTIESVPTRLFGYQLGDVVLDRVDIRMAPGLSLDPQSLPKLGKRLGAFTVRRIHQEPRPTVGGESRLLLTIEMQLINTPASIKTWTIPAIQLKFLGTPPAEAAMPSLTIDVAPLNTGEIRTGLPEAMELRRAPLIPLDAHIEAIQRYGAVSLVGLSWFLVTLLLAYRRQRAPHPFRDARRKVLRALHHIDSPEHARAAFILIHRAFDDTWGRRLFRSEVEAFCQAHGADATLQALTEQFFLVSEALFFESPARLPDDKQLKHSLKALLGLWGKIEQKAP